MHARKPSAEHLRAGQGVHCTFLLHGHLRTTSADEWRVERLWRMAPAREYCVYVVVEEPPHCAEWGDGANVAAAEVPGRQSEREGEPSTHHADAGLGAVDEICFCTRALDEIADDEALPSDTLAAELQCELADGSAKSLGGDDGELLRPAHAVLLGFGRHVERGVARVEAARARMAERLRAVSKWFAEPAGSEEEALKLLLTLQECVVEIEAMLKNAEPSASVVQTNLNELEVF